MPTRDSKLLLNLLRIQLETDPPSAPILKIALKVTPASPRVAQGGLFVPLAPDPEKLEITLARIAGLVGPQNVGSPHLLDSHRPGTFQMQPFAFMPPNVAPADLSFHSGRALTGRRREFLHFQHHPGAERARPSSSEGEPLKLPS